MNTTNQIKKALKAEFPQTIFSVKRSKGTAKMLRINWDENKTDKTDDITVSQFIADNFPDEFDNGIITGSITII